MSRTPLPAALGPVFAVADACAVGVSRGRLRSGDLDRPFHGVRTTTADVPHRWTVDRTGRPRGAAEIAHIARALAYAVRMEPHAFFSHVTAAVLLGIPVPSHLVGGPVDVSVFPPHRLPRAAGVRGHEASVRTTEVLTPVTSGLRIASVSSTWASLGAILRHPYDLVAAGDAIVRDWRVPASLATVAELERAVRAGRRVGIGRLRDALPLLRTRSASPAESRCRLELVDAGLPEPELNVDVFDAGVRLAAVDLAYPRARIAVEYEGEHHLLDPAQWTRDIARYDALRDAGWIVIRVTKTDLFGTPHAFIQRVRRALRSRT